MSSSALRARANNVRTRAESVDSRSGRSNPRGGFGVSSHFAGSACDVDASPEAFRVAARRASALLGAPQTEQTRIPPSTPAVRSGVCAPHFPRHAYGMIRGILLVFSLWVVGCGGASNGEPPGPLVCDEQPWGPEWCDGRPVEQVVLVCNRDDPGELGPGGIWTGAPRPACAPAEHASVAGAWCCW